MFVAGLILVHSKITSLYALWDLKLFSKDSTSLKFFFDYKFKSSISLNPIKKKIEYAGHSCITSLDIICSNYSHFHAFTFLMISFSFLFATSFRCDFFPHQGSWIINTAVNFVSSENYQLGISPKVTAIASGSWWGSSALVLKMINSCIKFFSVISPLLIFNLWQKIKASQVTIATPQGRFSFIEAPGSCTWKQENILKRERKRFYHGVLVLGLPSKENLRMQPVFARGDWNGWSELLRLWTTATDLWWTT